VGSYTLPLPNPNPSPDLVTENASLEEDLKAILESSAANAANTSNKNDEEPARMTGPTQSAKKIKKRKRKRGVNDSNEIHVEIIDNKSDSDSEAEDEEEETNSNLNSNSNSDTLYTLLRQLIDRTLHSTNDPYLSLQNDNMNRLASFLERAKILERHKNNPNLVRLISLE